MILVATRLAKVNFTISELGLKRDPFLFRFFFFVFLALLFPLPPPETIFRYFAISKPLKNGAR